MVWLRRQIRARGLPDGVATIATDGGVGLHPVLEYRAQAVSPSDDGPAWTVVTTAGKDGLVPLWTCGTTTVFSAADGTFLRWDAAENEPWETWPDFAGAVRHLLTDLWEDEENDDARAEVAHLLLPGGGAAAALVPEER